MSGWATKSGEVDVQIPVPSKNDERIHHDQEILEDEARQEHDAALVLLREKRYHEAKHGFQAVLSIDLVESPFRSRIFRSAAKNLARCFESLGDFHRALEALLKAASFLENDANDMALWLMIRRVASLACHVPAFRLADNVLRDKCSLQEYVPAKEPISCSFVDSEGVDRLFPRTVLIKFCTNEQYGWEDVLACLRDVDNDELVTMIEWRKESPAIGSVDIFSSEPETTEIPSLVSSPTNNHENKSNNTREGMNESVSPTNSEGLKTPKPQSGIKRMRERLTRAAQMKENDEESEEEEEELIDPTNHLPPPNPEISTKLLQWFEERIRLVDAKDHNNNNNRLLPSPVRSPIKEDSFPVTPQKEKDALKEVVSSIFQLSFPILGMDLLAHLFTLMYDYFESIPTKYIAEAYSLMVLRNVSLNEDQKWLGVLCRADIVHSLAGLSAREIVTMDADMGDELWLIEKASHSSNVRLASRTFRRCAERALLMKRKLLVEIALDQLKNLDLPQDKGFILTMKEKLAKLSNNEELDTILEECAVDSPAFAKDPHECMRIVADACFMVSPTSSGSGPRRARPAVFAGYRLDVLKAGLDKEKETLVRLALEFVPPIDLPESEVAKEVDLTMDGEPTDEVTVFNYAEMERIVCRLFYTFPSLFSRSFVDLFDQSPGQKQLWNSIIPSAWIWASSHGEEDESTRYVERLKVLSCYDDFVGVSPDDLICMIHAMVELSARRSVICAVRSLPLWTETTREFIENALSLCVYALEDKEVNTALEVSEMLLHDARLAKLFHEMRGPADAPFSAVENVTGKAKQKQQDDGELDLEDEREKILADSASLLLTSESEEYERLDWMMEQAPRLWEFLAPHMWCTNKTQQILTLTSKRDYLERRLLRAVSEAPVSRAIYEIHNGGIWFHLTRFGIGEAEEEEDGSDGKEEKAVDDAANVMSDKTRTLHLWLERDLQVEPHRLSSLLELGKILFQEEQRKRIEEQKKARLEKGTKSSGDPEAAEVEEVKATPRPDPATLKAKERFNVRKYQTSLDCFAEIEKVLVRQGSQGVKTCSLVTWRGRWAIAARVSDGTVDLLTMDEQQARFEEMKERQVQYYRNSRLPHHHATNDELEEEIEDNESSRFGLDKDSVDSPRPAKRSKKDSDGDERWSSRKAAARRQEVLRRIPIEEVSPLPLSAFQVSGVYETIRYMMCDVLPTELHKLRLDVSEYLILNDVIGRSEQYILAHEEIERVQQCIEICEYANDDRAWSFYWFKGYVESDRRAFDRSASLAKKLALQIRKHGTKKQKTKAFCYMVGYVDASARACLIRLKECRGKQNEPEVREKLASELKIVHKEDKDNLLACRLLQDLLGCDNDAIDAAFYIMKRWDSGSILFDHLRELDWEEEVAETFSARVEAISQRSDPLPGALSLLNFYFSKKLDKVVEKSDFDDLVNLVLTKGVPASTDMEGLYLATVNFTNKIPAVKRACDARLQQLGEQEWGMTSFGEIMDECNKRFSKNAAKKGAGRKIFRGSGGNKQKPGQNKGESIEDSSKSTLNEASVIGEVQRSNSFSPSTTNNNDGMDVENTTTVKEEVDIFQ